MSGSALLGASHSAPTCPWLAVQRWKRPRNDSGLPVARLLRATPARPLDGAVVKGDMRALQWPVAGAVPPGQVIDRRPPARYRQPNWTALACHTASTRRTLEGALSFFSLSPLHNPDSERRLRCLPLLPLPPPLLHPHRLSAQSPFAFAFACIARLSRTQALRFSRFGSRAQELACQGADAAVYFVHPCPHQSQETGMSARLDNL
ncbi:hypothetical protein GGI35DRAFT_381855 [Trichoderma velutinum]